MAWIGLIDVILDAFRVALIGIVLVDASEAVREADAIPVGVIDGLIDAAIRIG